MSISSLLFHFDVLAILRNRLHSANFPTSPRSSLLVHLKNDVCSSTLTVPCVNVHAARLSLSHLWSALFLHLFTVTQTVSRIPCRVISVMQWDRCCLVLTRETAHTNSPHIQSVATDSDQSLSDVFRFCHCGHIGSLKSRILQI